MILDEIIADRKIAVANLKTKISLQAIKDTIKDNTNNNKFKKISFKAALSGGDIGIIAEVKKASPSKGLICKDFDYKSIAKEYEKGGALALSVLTEPKYFKGSDKYLSEIKELVNIPILRKDFIIDEYQIYEAKSIGADALLLIVAALTDEELNRFYKVAKKLDLDCLVEAHNEQEVQRALNMGADIIGVNNRNLKTFEVSIDTTEKLRTLIPEDKIFVTESGIHTNEDVKRLRKLNISAMLIGESIVKEKDRIGKMKELLK